MRKLFSLLLLICLFLPSVHGESRKYSSSARIASIISELNFSAKKIVPEAKRDISEEELFATILYWQIKTGKTEVMADRFANVFSVNRQILSDSERYPSAEKAVGIAMQYLVKVGDISRNELANFKKIAFNAAQLDSNSRKLYDRYPSTRAVSSLSKALRKAASRLG